MDKQPHAKIKVVIVDDHGLLRQGIASLLEGEREIQVISCLSSGEEAVNLHSSLQPDVFLMDIMMKGMNGIEATRWIKEQNPVVKIILISSEINKDFITAGIKAKIDGYLLKDVTKEDLIAAIRKVVGGEQAFSAEVTSLVFQDFYLKETEGKGLPTKKSSELTKRENEVLALIAQGKSLKEIADTLFISVKTVETHKLNIQDKLNLSNVAQLVKYAFENKLV
ncbi:response regulator transcription factor [Fulvivirgaceae bacterium PWU4]|uniref:Response regulator transcription factor n=1 Tax=Chryseosolibacter histidini TaxID=2782349 RepID=A0AAP2GI50_9BACT|nr:response regulator transcription factor [Chryseosolibacter histidini]MBT1696759.1 response regulator transcription factor [Chryseosolibacter histidini]